MLVVERYNYWLMLSNSNKKNKVINSDGGFETHVFNFTITITVLYF